MITRSITTFLLCMQVAHASLGGDSASADLVTPMQGYDIHAITSGGGGMRISEYVDRSGRVFAVSWSGPVMPDLQSLLGASFAAYTAALAQMAQRPLHRVVRVATPELVVESAGHMRAFIGRAYLPALIPAGMSTSDVR